ncbi:flippase-like domain-containing protein [Paracrocinitomix mangrovi]|uniref:lysylphosphatidylglycerol synthase transmembrane domain-containing protein n=1 Tax=Paracrocinitomix mangrovi TaxID=2862509 RepID=UPI001C8F1349|nr:lysylphosphatidylglycerol synthase transmembrane domain-containing protein [Paracrocinitomix mangrovi]UKN03409.1 flippase-like domain-containing protein [Paracrocinitomix mangrovi]
MKSKLINILKILLPLGFGIFLIWLFYDALCEDQKADLFDAFGRVDYFWVVLALVFSFLSHASRAYRWKYLLDPLGHKVSYWSAYHALMIGYIVNLVFPRAGEPFRAGVISKTENVPFKKGFGTIIAERAIDVVMLGIVTLVMLGLQINKIDLFQAKIETFQAGEMGCGNAMVFTVLGQIVKWVIILGFLAVVLGTIFMKSLRKKIKDFALGVIEGLKSVLKTKYKLQFIGHTFFIWIMYILMFSVCFFAIEETSDLGIDAMLAGFVAGTIGIVLVQGGIGVYPAFVGLIVTIYIAPDLPGIHPAALALGWIIWTSQTLMMIVLGLISLAINGKNIKFDRDAMAQSDS